MGPEIVVGLLVAWAAGRSARLAPRVDGLSGAAVDLAMDRVHAVVVARLGGNEAVERLLVEAGTERGAVTARTRADAVAAVAATMRADEEFAGALADAVGPAATEPVAAPRPVRRRAELIRRRPALAAAAAVTGILLVAGAAGIAVDKGSAPAPRAPGPGGTGRAGPAGLVGAWAPSDGTAAKTFTGNGGVCAGFYYRDGHPLDADGTCTLTTAPDPAGRYTLLVELLPDSARYQLEFPAADHVVVYDQSGARLYELRRF